MANDKEPKISVCMATRDGAKYIAEQLASILAQLEPDDEVIVSDDSSTDATVAIIKGFNDRRVRVLENNAFFSPIFNFEHALKQAKGDIIVLSDQDDIWLENKISLIRDRFRHDTSSIHLAAFDGCAIDEAGEIIEASLFRRIKAGKGLLKNIYDNTYMGCCIAFSRPLLEIALPFPRRIPMHDMWLGLLAELFGSVEFFEEKTILYRKHAASTTEFRRRFTPLVQIRRRAFLCWSLAARCFALRKRGRGCRPLWAKAP